jgi:hypothetical protein
LRIKIGAIAGVLAIGALLPLTPAGAAPAEQHCAARVIDKRASGELVLGPTVCRATREAALVAVSNGSKSTWTIGTHYDGFSFGGSSFSVVGSNCSGGWLNLDGSWDNRVSSTVNGCNRVIHYDGDNLTGTAQTTSGSGGNLTYLNNMANSVQYLA